MAVKKVKVLARSWINNRIVEAGEVIEYDGEIGSNLELVKSPKPAPAAAPADSGADEPI